MNTRRGFIRNSALLAASAVVARQIGLAGIKSRKAQDDIILATANIVIAWIKRGQKSMPQTPLANCHEMVFAARAADHAGDEVKNNILIFDKNGKLLDTWGHGFPGGHGLTITNEGGTDFLLLPTVVISTTPKAAEQPGRTGAENN